jgi:beta-N-acetylhexosaminidase
MNPLHRAAKLIGIDLPGLSLDDATRSHLAKYRFGGVCLFGKNVQDRAQLAELIGEIREELGPEAWVSIDQEGGAVLRTTDLPDPPSAMALGAVGDAGLAEQVGSAIARGLIGLGINWNYAPVLDVNINPHNPVIGDRSFGSDPKKVAELGLAFARGLERYGVAATAKHFPGHGDTAVDSHLGLPRVDKSLEELEATELYPFHRAVEQGIASIMTAHILYPALDQENPATLSRKILTGLLRGEWGYSGVIVTDSMGMKAMADNYSPADAAVRSVRAGADVVLALGRREAQIAQVEAIAAAVESGQISQARLGASLERIEELKHRFPGIPEPYSPHYEEADRVLMRQLAAQSLTTHGPVVWPKAGDRILLVAPESAQGEHVYEANLTLQSLAGHLSLKFERLTVMGFQRNSPSVATQKLTSAIYGADYVLYASTSRRPLDNAEKALARRVFDLSLSLGKPALHLALWNPYHVAMLGQPALISYGFRTPSLEAVAEVLAGREALGKLPIRLI